MTILINASKEKAGGGIQVSDSICTTLNLFQQHQFIVVVSEKMKSTYAKIHSYPNVKAYIHTFKDSLFTLATGRYKYLDDLVEKNKVTAVLTVFGPARWKPKVKHLCGFARAHLVMDESPFFSRLTYMKRLKEKIECYVVGYFFNRNKPKYFYSENSDISLRVEKYFKNSKCFTVTNYYNQVFDEKKEWLVHTLPPFNGVTILTISSYYPHKNLEISIDIAKYLKKKYPEFKFRFVFTIDKKDFKDFDESVNDHFCFIGTVRVNECPSLYEQCDIAFQPTLLECFTATYPESMRMRRPIVTTDMGFAKSQCGEAACYYSAVDPISAAEAIYKVATDKEYASELTNKGEKQLHQFDDYLTRTRKLIKILEEIQS